MKRKFDRVVVKGIFGDVAIDNSIINGIVQDISPGGFKLSRLPDSLIVDKHVYTVVITKGDSHYKLLAKPCWEQKLNDTASMDVGFKVIDSPWEWAELTMAVD